MYILNTSEYENNYKNKDESYVFLVLAGLIIGNYIIYRLGKSIRVKLKK